MGGSATGEIETSKDFDWFAVDLVAGHTYVIGLEGADSGGGALQDPVLRGLYDADGNRIAGARDNDGGAGRDARLTFTAAATGAYYIEARGHLNQTGDYTVRVTEWVDTDAERGGATDLGDITALAGLQFPAASLDGSSDSVDYWRFTLSEARRVGLGLRQQDANADLFLEDAEGNVLYSGTEEGTASEWISQTLPAGTYFVRVEAQEEGANEFKLRYGVSGANPDVVAALEQQQQGTDEAPVFAQPSYAFDLAENADGALFGIAVAPVVATDPDNDRITYSIEAGDPDGLFMIDAETGLVVYLGTGEDYESGTRSYELTVRASDGGLHSDVTVTVNVTDVAEAPAFAEASYAFSLAENADGGTISLALGRVTATDPENSTITYSIESGDSGGLFEIDAASGEVFYIGVGEDYESGTTSYELTVRASDGTNATDTIVTVNVTDLQEQTIVAPADPEILQSVSEPYGEDLPTNTSTIGRVAVGGTATGKIGSTGDRDWFAVTLDADRTYRIDLEGSRNGAGTLCNPYLRGVHDADGVFITGTTDNDGGAGYNARVTFTADKAGTYYVAAGDYGTRKGTYTLSVVDVTDGIPDDFEAGTGTSGAVAVGGSATGEIDFYNDRDWFAVTLEANSTYQIDLEGEDTDAGTLKFPYLYGVHDADGVLIAGTTHHGGGTGCNSQVYFTAEDAGTYYVVAGSHRADEGTYKLSVAELADGIPDDFAAETGTSGSVAVSGSARGEIEVRGDRDWFAVELDAGATYQIDLKGSSTGAGTLLDPYLRGVHDADGNFIAGTTDNHGGVGLNGRVRFTAEEAGTYYVAAGAGGYGYRRGTYKLSVTEVPDDFAAGTGTSGAVEVGGSVTSDIEISFDRDWFAVTLEAGATYRIDLKGSPTGSGTLSDPYLYGVHDADGNFIPARRTTTAARATIAG